MEEDNNIPVPTIILAMDYIQEELVELYTAKAMLIDLCDQLYASLKQMDSLHESDEDSLAEWNHNTNQALALYEQMFPCCEDCEEAERLRIERGDPDDRVQ